MENMDLSDKSKEALKSGTVTTEAAEDKQEETPADEVPANSEAEDFKEKACEKLRGEKDKAADKPAEPKPKKNSKDMDGQMDLFSMMGV